LSRSRTGKGKQSDERTYSKAKRYGIPGQFAERFPEQFPE